ncbi:sugar phosphate isomerase/epimerase family protein [Desulfobacula toluolica]|uniref:Xylose isormerase domain protein, TIM barrel n=1 Tax=Desulfobacula toluolica (strain DSM 7467 / Tol2) TaxID=651182 RepID=K0NSI0_DESTT|nr:sugar phosphate isomerase/epimerase family protein [Desulfobacula toluolica]CCK81942.1 xylose isormerase domain protein, TIM barrel [Desulfobacula toluolica Tol2]
MKYGAMNFPIKPVLEELEKISGLGFDYLELTLDAPYAHYTKILEMENKLVNALKQHSMGLVCHLPSFVYTADLTPGIREISLKEMIHSLETAARIGAQKAVLHPSYISGLGPLAMKTAEGYAHQSLCTIMKQADHLGIQLCFENMFPNYHSFFDPSHFTRIFKEFPDLKMTLDAGHANIDDPGKTKLYEFIQRFSDRIRHIHISDNSGKKDDHARVGNGTVNFKKFIRLLKQSGYDDTITLEIFSPDTKDLVKSRDQIALLVNSA